MLAIIALLISQMAHGEAVIDTVAKPGVSDDFQPDTLGDGTVVTFNVNSGCHEVALKAGDGIVFPSGEVLLQMRDSGRMRLLVDVDGIGLLYCKDGTTVDIRNYAEDHRCDINVFKGLAVVDAFKYGVNYNLKRGHILDIEDGRFTRH